MCDVKSRDLGLRSIKIRATVLANQIFNFGMKCFRYSEALPATINYAREIESIFTDTQEDGSDMLHVMGIMYVDTSNVA